MIESTMADTFETQFTKKVEAAAEKRESKEAETNPELQAAATLERADYLVKEVKNSKQQMQNIVLHMQQVKQAIKNIRQQLQLVLQDDNHTDSSVAQDEAQVARLKKQIAAYSEEIHHMKDDLIAAQIEELKKIDPGTNPLYLNTKAVQMVEALIGETSHA